VLVLIARDYDEMSLRAAAIVAATVERKPDAVLGLPTGSTPVGLYRELVRLSSAGLDFSSVTTFNLDEYVGLAPDHPRSFRHFMDTNLFRHVPIDRERIHVPTGLPTTGLDARCAEYEASIAAAGGIALQILGIGRDGHIGFNEPTSSLQSRTRVKTLTAETMRDNARYFDEEQDAPVCAITMGIGTILDAKNILLLASGRSKASAIAKTVEGPIAASCPASALQWHQHATILVDEDAASELELIDYYRHVMATTEGVTPERLR